MPELDCLRETPLPNLSPNSAPDCVPATRALKRVCSRTDSRTRAAVGDGGEDTGFD